MEPLSSELLRFVLEYREKSVSQSFEELLTNEINIAEGIRSIASKSQQHLREFLDGESSRDQSFPSILKSIDSDFLGGSFARHTKVRPLDDIDIYLPLDGAALFYVAHDGTPLPYWVASDRLAFYNVLLEPRWAIGSLVSSSKLIDGFAAVLKRRFPNTSIKPDGQAVNVRMTQGASDSSDGLGYDVVPCFSLAPKVGSGQSFYLIADGNNGWIRTNPRIDANVADVLQDSNGKIFRKVVKIIKYWNLEALDGALSSYFIELAIARLFWARNVNSESLTKLSYGVAVGFWAVQQAVANGGQLPWLDGAPHVVPGTALAGHRLRLSSSTSLACGAWEDEKARRFVSATAKWKQVFGPSFPD